MSTFEIMTTKKDIEICYQDEQGLISRVCIVKDQIVSISYNAIDMIVQINYKNRSTDIFKESEWINKEPIFKLYNSLSSFICFTDDDRQKMAETFNQSKGEKK